MKPHLAHFGCLVAVLAMPLAAWGEDAPGTLETRWFDVGELTLGTTDFIGDHGPSPVTADQVNDEAHPMFGGEEEGSRPYGMSTDLIELVKSAIGPEDEWSRDGVVLRTAGSHRIVVRAPRALLDAVGAVLADLARPVRWTLTFDVVVLSGDVTAVPAGGLASAVGRGLVPIASARACGAPRQTVVGRQGAQTAYLQDFDVEVAEKSQIPDPIVGVLQDGLSFEARALAVSDTRVRVALDAWWARASITRSTSPVDSGPLSLPDVDGRTAAATLDLVPGTWSLLPSSGAGADGIVFAVRATVRPFDGEPLGPPSPPAAGERSAGSGPTTLRVGRNVRSADAFPAGALDLRGYDVGDLLARPASRRGVPVDLWPSNFTPGELPELPEAVSVVQPDELVETWRVDPWYSETEGASIETKLGVLWVRADDAHHGVVERGLEDLRARLLGSSRVRAIVVRLPLASLPEYWRGLDGALVADGGTSLAGRAGARVLDRASVRLTSGQRDAMVSGKHHMYVSDYDVEIATDARIANPIVAKFFEGLVLDVEAVPTRQGSGVVCQVRLDRSELRGITRVRTKSGEIDAPSIGLLRCRGSLTIPYGSTQILAANVDGADVTLVLLSASRD